VLPVIFQARKGDRGSGREGAAEKVHISRTAGAEGHRNNKSEGGREHYFFYGGPDGKRRKKGYRMYKIELRGKEGRTQCTTCLRKKRGKGKSDRPRRLGKGEKKKSKSSFQNSSLKRGGS